jgi:ATP-dependent Clp protease ATP-binding subunit ClpC
MNYNFTDGIRQALARAREESVRLRHHFVGTEHILLGLLADEQVRGILRALGVTPPQVKAAVEAKVRPGAAAALHGELPYTSRAKKVLELSMSAARERGDTQVRTEHALVALIREQTGIAAEVLGTLGITEERIASGSTEGAASRSSPA